MNTFLLTVASPDGNLFEGEVRVLFLRGAEGDLAILAGHIPFLTTIKPGPCKIECADGAVKRAHTEGGLLTVTEGGATLLAGSFRWDEQESVH